MMKRIYLIDCAGIVPPSAKDTEEDILLRGVVRVENVEYPSQYVDAVLRRVQTKHIERTYDVKYDEYQGDAVEFLSILARKGGRLLKGGEADVDAVAKMVLNDFLRGKIPWFTPVPRKEGESTDKDATAAVVEGREGKLGERPGKKTVEEAKAENQSDEEPADEEDLKVLKGEGAEDEFESFSDDDDEDGDDAAIAAIAAKIVDELDEQDSNHEDEDEEDKGAAVDAA